MTPGKSTRHGIPSVHLCKADPQVQIPAPPARALAVCVCVCVLCAQHIVTRVAPPGNLTKAKEAKMKPTTLAGVLCVGAWEGGWVSWL